MPKTATSSALSTAARAALAAASALGTRPARRAAKSIAKRGLLGGIVRQFTHPYRKNYVSQNNFGMPASGFDQGAGTVAGAVTGGNSFSFSRAPAAGAYTHGLRISGSIRFGSVYVNSTGTKVSFVSADGATTKAAGTDFYPVTVAIDPNTTTGCFSGSPMLQAIANYHSRFRFERLDFRFIPAGNTSTNGAFGYAYSAEPSPAQGGAAGYLLLDRQGAISVPAWHTARMKTDVARGRELYYTTDVAPGSTADATIIAEIAARQVHQGAFMVNVVQTVSASQNGHQIFLDFVIDLYDHRSSSSLGIIDVGAAPPEVYIDAQGNRISFATEAAREAFLAKNPRARSAKTEKSAAPRDDNPRDVQLRRLVTDDVREDYVSLPRPPPLAGGGGVTGAGGAPRAEATPRPPR